MQSVVKITLFHLWNWSIKLSDKLTSLYHGIAFKFSYTGLSGRLKLGRGNTFSMPVSRRYSIGTIKIGSNNSFGYRLAGFHGEIFLQARTKQARIIIGNNCHFSNSITIISCNSIEIGDNFLCGDRVMIVDSDFHGVCQNREMDQSNEAPVKIGNNVWLGSEVTVLKGVTIGDNAVVGAKSLVTKDVPANCIAVGTPAKVIRKLN